MHRASCNCVTVRGMIGRTQIRASLISFALLLLACPLPPTQRPYPPPTAAELIASLRAHADHLHSLRATAKVDHLANGGQRVKVKVTMLLARPDKLRFEAESPLGGTLAYLTADGRDFALLDVRENRFLVGPANSCNVARLIRLTLPPEDIVTLLMGDVPLAGEPGDVSWDPSHGGREVLTLHTPDGGRETIKLDGRDKRWDLVGAERMDAQGHVLWRLNDDGWSDHDGIRMPDTIHVEDPAHKADAVVKLRALEPNASLSDSVFQLQPPDKITPEQASCDTQ
jgi:outer membrane lipoprotein-sorting protein